MKNNIQTIQVIGQGYYFLSKFNDCPIISSLNKNTMNFSVLSMLFICKSKSNTSPVTNQVDIYIIHVKCNDHHTSNNLHNNILIVTMHASEKKLSFIYTYHLQPSCIIISMVLLRCYQYHRCYDLIWAANHKLIQ